MGDVMRLFEEFDKTGDGTIDYKELEKLLHRRGGYVAPAAPQPKGNDMKFAIRKGGKANNNPFHGAQINLTSDVPLYTQLKELLKTHSVRVIDWFRSMDENHDQRVSKKEFRHAFEGLGIPPERMGEVDQLFASFDMDKSGALDMKELDRSLRKSTPPQPPSTGTAAIPVRERAPPNLSAMYGAPPPAKPPAGAAGLPVLVVVRSQSRSASVRRPIWALCMVRQQMSNLLPAQVLLQDQLALVAPSPALLEAPVSVLMAAAMLAASNRPLHQTWPLLVPVLGMARLLAR